MKNVKVVLSGLVMLVLVFVVLTGCSNGSSRESGGNQQTGSDSNTENVNDKNSGELTEPVTIEFWHTYSDTEAKVFKEKVLPLFKEKHPNITVKATRMPTKNLRQQVIAAAAGDAAPDVMRMDIVWVPEFAKLGALKSVSDMEGFDGLKNKMYKAPFATNFYNGKYYGIPLDTNTKVAIYNKKVLEAAGLSEPPKTFDELISAAEKLKSQGKYGLAINGTAPWGILPYFWSFGGKLTNDDYTKASGYLNSPESIAALNKILTLKEKGIVGPTLLGGEPTTWDGLKGGTYLMTDDGPWFYTLLKNAEELTVPAMIPSGKGGSVSVIGGEDLVMFQNTDHQKASWIFMNFMVTKKPQIIMGTAGQIPVNKEAANSEKVLSIPYIKPYIKQLEHARPRTPSPNWEKIKEILNKSFEKAARGEGSAEEVLNQAAKKMDGLLK